MRKLLKLIFIFFGLLVVAPAWGHDLPHSYLNLRLTKQGLEAQLTSHAFDFADPLHISNSQKLYDPIFLEANRAALETLINQGLAIVADGEVIPGKLQKCEPRPELQSLTVHFEFAWRKIPGVLHVASHLFLYDPRRETFVSVAEGKEILDEEILGQRHDSFDYFTNSARGSLAVIRKFVPAGIEHIFIGPDHILFIIGLLLAGGSWKRLLLLITAFTLAHSITLALASLGFVDPSPRLIEPLIALSIVCVGLNDWVMRKKQGGRKRDWRAALAFCFGLIHGFGFAGVLREFGLPRAALGWSLFSFNVGVELGQLSIVLVALPILVRLPRKVAAAVSLLIIGVGSWWLVQRLLA